MKVLVATIMIISFFIDILIDIQSIYCSTSKLGSKCVHNQVTIRLSTLLDSARMSLITLQHALPSNLDRQ